MPKTIALPGSFILRGLDENEAKGGSTIAFQINL